MVDVVYVVLARLGGHWETHSYVVGVFEEMVDALRAKDAEDFDRAGKYSCEVIRMVLNARCEPEIIEKTTHSRNYKTCLCICDDEGRVDGDEGFDIKQVRAHTSAWYEAMEYLKECRSKG